MYVIQKLEGNLWRTVVTLTYAVNAALVFDALTGRDNPERFPIADALDGGSIFEDWSADLSASVRVMNDRILTGQCHWYVRCDRPSIGARVHPVLGSVEICDRCNGAVEALHAHSATTNGADR